jgi:hypothetical protein
MRARHGPAFEVEGLAVGKRHFIAFHTTDVALTPIEGAAGVYAGDIPIAATALALWGPGESVTAGAFATNMGGADGTAHGAGFSPHVLEIARICEGGRRRDHGQSDGCG